MRLFDFWSTSLSPRIGCFFFVLRFSVLSKQKQISIREFSTSFLPILWRLRPPVGEDELQPLMLSVAAEAASLGVCVFCQELGKFGARNAVTLGRLPSTSWQTLSGVQVPLSSKVVVTFLFSLNTSSNRSLGLSLERQVC